MHLIIAGSLVLVIIGAWPAVDHALYMTALSTGLVFAGYALLVGVLSQSQYLGRRHATTPDASRSRRGAGGPLDQM
jgi:hypothetical protein